MKWYNTTSDRQDEWIAEERAKKEAARLAAAKEAEKTKQGNAEVGDKRDRDGDWKPRDDQSPNTWNIDYNGDSVPDLDDLLNSEPNTEDLINNSAPDPTSDMDIDQEGPAPTEAAARASGGSSNPISRETPISRYPSLTYGLQETHTTILPWVGWCSMYIVANRTVAGTGTSSVSNDKGVTLRIHLNRPSQMIPDVNEIALSTSPAVPGIYNQPGSLTSGTANMTYPATLKASGADQIPQWLTWWARLYEQYTVLSTEYEVVLNNVEDSHGGRVLIGYEMDSYSDTEGASGNIIPDCTLVEALNFKNMKWRNLGTNRNTVSDGHETIIRGIHKPGSIRRNVVNDGDVKTWTKTEIAGTIELPKLHETLTIKGWRHPLSYSPSETSWVHVQVKLKFIVQFKDLRAALRYPSAINGTQISVQTALLQAHYCP